MTQPPSPAPTSPRPKAWYARWWAIVLYAVVGLCGLGTVGAALGGGDEGADVAGGTDDATSDMDDIAEDFSAEVDDLTEPIDPPGEADQWASFETQTYTGSGDDVIDLPDGATEGMITASHDGDANFIIDVLTSAGDSTLDLPVNTIGSYEGTTAFGMYDINDDPDRLQVSADGAWEITVAPFADAPTLELPAEGDGDAVFVYSGGASAWHLTHAGEANFIVDSTAEVMGLVNEIGAYDGTVPVSDETAVITIRADGAWTVEAG